MRGRKAVWWAVGGIVAVIVLAFGIPFVYIQFIEGDAPPEFSVSEGTATTGGSTAQPVSVDGTWKVSEGSQAGYRVDEVLSGQNNTVVGRTDAVSGSVTVAEGSVTAAHIVVETAHIATDESARDNYLEGQLDPATHPEATFDIADPVKVPELVDGAAAVTVSAKGTLTIKGISHDVTASLDLALRGDVVQVVGKIPVTFSDFDVTAPDLGFVKVEPAGTVEVLLMLTK